MDVKERPYVRLFFNKGCESPDLDFIRVILMGSAAASMLPKLAAASALVDKKQKQQVSSILLV
ncbi:hypothetical protein [Shewanella benthica]|uniref:hypothetical protein n=1 Tax=Shewanella benthica TaxID=43661 RepID=UPI0011AE863F|nr:hypothetical protein [Shewanella benthica]